MTFHKEVREKCDQITGQFSCQNCGMNYAENLAYTYRTSNGQKRKLCPPCGEKRIRRMRDAKRQMRELLK